MNLNLLHFHRLVAFVVAQFIAPLALVCRLGRANAKPIGVNLSTQLPDCLLWEGFISPIYMYLSGLKTRQMPKSAFGVDLAACQTRMLR